MSSHDFEDRLRRTFDAEAGALAERADGRGDAGQASAAALVEEAEPEPRQPSGRSRALVPLLAAALLLVAGIAGVVALANDDSPTVAIDVAGPSPLVTATPTPEVSPAVVATADVSDVVVHLVEPGDTVGAIAIRYNVTLDVILRANPDLDPAVLRIGDRIRVPGASTLVDPEVATPGTPVPASPIPSESAPQMPEPAAEPTPTRPPLPTAVPITPLVTATPVPPDFDVAEPLCLVRDTPWLPLGTCGLEVIGPILGAQIPVQVVDEAGRVEAGYLPVDALAPGDAPPRATYQPGLLEDAWCVTEIFSPDTLNIRQGPSTAREIVGELTEGQCRIYRTEVPGSLTFDGWTAISADQLGGAPLSGWVASRYLRRDVERVPPGIPMQTISVRAVAMDPSLAIPAIDEFELFDGRLQLGRPSADGVIEIPAATDPFVVGASAPVEGDRFCAWTGALGPTDSAGYHVMTVAMLCT